MAVAGAGSDEWVRVLGGPERAAGERRLHGMLVEVARAELRRRSGRHRIAGVELDDLAHQAAADAMLAILGKLGEFRGESRFTTWAYKFVVFEVSAALGRHFWRHAPEHWDAEDWDRLPDRFALDPAESARTADLAAALRAAVEQDLTDRQRRVFAALVLNGVPLDALAAELGSTRNALYKTLFDARRRLRAGLIARGQLDEGSPS
jgi:RNA polymerase sigma-70 factor, ECF subfamily